MLIVQLRPAAVAVTVALSGRVGQAGRLCRIAVSFPDIGPKTTHSLGYLRYTGEPSFVVPDDQTEVDTSARSDLDL